MENLGRTTFLRVTGQFLILAVFLAAILFLPAGTWSWARGWVFLLVVMPALVAAALRLWRVNPEIFEARRRIQMGTKTWDRVLLAFLFTTMGAILPIAALDDARFRWFPTPWWVCVIGYALLLAGIAIFAWAQAVNRFFEPGVRIQSDRGHAVIDRGPYSIVRHPGYVGAHLLFAGMALSLGSVWALIPAALSSLLLILRTAWEDRTLREELPGYEEYARRVRWRAVPGVW